MPEDAQPLPHSIEAEEHILSAVFIDGIRSLTMLMDQHISAESFYLPINRNIFLGLLWLHKNNLDLSLDVFVTEMRKVGKLESVGDMAYLVQMTSKTPTTAQLSYYIERVRETFVLRQLIKTALNTIQLAQQQKIDVEDFTAEVNRILSIRNATYVIKTLSQATDEALATAERIRQGKATEEDLGLSWAWPDFDLKFGKKQAGQLIILAARPSVGKSSMARQDCVHVSKAHGQTALFSREMPIGELPPLFAQQLCGVSWKEFRKRTLGPQAEDHFMTTLRSIKKLNALHIFDKDRNLAQMNARIRAFAQIKPVKFLAIDYLQRFDPQQEKGETRDVALGRMSMAFKDLAVDLKIPVLLLCQVGRELEKENREPRMSDLRECFCIETTWIYTPQGICRNHSAPMQVSAFSALGEIMEATSRHAERETAETVEVNLALGKKLICTFSHPIMTDQGWVKAGDLTQDHVVACAARIPAPQNTEAIPGARWIGRMIGNGSYARGTPCFISSCSELAESFAEETQQLFGFRPKTKRQPRANVQEVYLSKDCVRTNRPNPVTDWLRRMDLWGVRAQEKTIPVWFCASADNASLALLLGGLFETDGSFHDRQASYSTTSEVLAQQIIWALLRLGITASAEPPRTSQKANFPIYKLRVMDPGEMAKFREMIPVIGRKGSVLKAMCLAKENNTFGSRLPSWVSNKIADVLSFAGLNSSAIGYRPQRKRIHQDKLLLVLGKLSELGIQCPELNRLLMPDVRWVPVRSVKAAGVRRVFDRVVPVHHALVVNGICAHNSGNLEQDADRIIFLHTPATNKHTGFAQDVYAQNTTSLYVEAIQAKGRGDGRARCGLMFELPTTTFRPLSVAPAANTPSMF